MDLVKQESIALIDMLKYRLSALSCRSCSYERATITAVRLVSSGLEKVTNTNVLRIVKPPGKPKMLERKKIDYTGPFVILPHFIRNHRKCCAGALVRKDERNLFSAIDYRQYLKVPSLEIVVRRSVSCNLQEQARVTTKGSL